ncbi:MAG: phosphotransferase [Gemmatimonadales bacterium]
MKDTIFNSQRVLSHWDYRVENMFFGAGGELVVIDWQLMNINNPANDLAYLLGSNVDVTLRRSAERDLMQLFLEGLRQHGVEGYSASDLERDYRLALLAVSAIPIIGGASADITNERSAKLFGVVGARLFQAVEDWEALGALP